MRRSTVLGLPIQLCSVASFLCSIVRDKERNVLKHWHLISFFSLLMMFMAMSTLRAS
jgi:hypothetical protein